MCGIFGYSFKRGAASEGARAILASQLAELNDERGGHSWGFTTIDGSKLTIERGLGDFHSHAHRAIGAEVLIGHTRWATHGEKTVANAHPFEVGTIVGSHNGVLYNHAELNKLHGRKHVVDSLHLFSHLSEGKPFDDIEGYGSIEWVDRMHPTVVNLCKMASGELAVYGVGKHGAETGIIWSSDEKHLRRACRLAGLTVFAFKIDEGKVHTVEDGKLWITPQTLTLSEKTSGKRWKWSDFADDKWPDGEIIDDVYNFRPDGTLVSDDGVDLDDDDGDPDDDADFDDFNGSKSQRWSDRLDEANAKFYSKRAKGA